MIRVMITMAIAATALMDIALVLIVLTMIVVVVHLKFCLVRLWNGVRQKK